MTSISFPTNVAVLFRRLVNVVSTFSISKHYFCEDSAGLKTHPERAETNHLSPSLRKEWPKWVQGCHWDSMLSFEEKLNVLSEVWASRQASGGIMNASSVTFPWANRNWWPSVFSPLEQQGPSASPPPSRPEPSPDLNNNRDSPSQNQENKSLNGIQESTPDIIHQLLVNPALYDPLRTPRYPIVLCHGLYGFDVRGPSSMRMHYWANVLQILRGKVGAEVIVTAVPGTGNIPSRSARLDEQLRLRARGRGVNLLAHSMGGLDCRHLITHIQPNEYTPLSLTTISTPHRGSPFMDWCVENLGIGKLRQHERDLLYARCRPAEDDEFNPPPRSELPGSSPTDEASASSSSFNFTSLPSSFTTLLLSVMDSPAYSNLTSAYLNDVFNPATPDDPKVKYWSVAGRVPGVSVWHPFWLPKMILDGAEESERLRLREEVLAKGEDQDPRRDPQSPPLWADEREWGNDGLVTVQSAKWGEFLGTMNGCDHWEMRGARGIEFGVDLPAIPALGLGVGPDASPSSSKDTPPSPSQKEKWSIREWGQFVGGWKKDDQLEPRADALSSDSLPVRSDEGEQVSSLHTLADREEARREREREFVKGDEVVRSSTDKLSMVVDWLVDQIPAPQILAGAGSILPSSVVKGKMKETSVDTSSDSSTRETKELAAQMVAHSVAGSASVRSESGEGSPSTPAFPSPRVDPAVSRSDNLRAEVKKVMERERKRLKKNELGSKADMERFYVALSRKMWDEGL